MEIEFPTTCDFSTAAIFVKLARLCKARVALYADPMSVGAPLDDFAVEYDIKERELLYELYRRAEQTRERKVLEFANDAIMQWAP